MKTETDMEKGNGMGERDQEALIAGLAVDFAEIAKCKMERLGCFDAYSPDSVTVMVMACCHLIAASLALAPDEETRRKVLELVVNEINIRAGELAKNR